MNSDIEAAINAITEKIIGCAYKVANEMGCGFFEKCYENAMVHELRKAGLAVQQLKAIKACDEVHAAQCINYLAATGLPICLLINFGKRVEVKRFIRGQLDPA